MSAGTSTSPSPPKQRTTRNSRKSLAPLEDKTIPPSVPALHTKKASTPLISTSSVPLTPPKKPAPPFFLYCLAKRPLLRKKHPDATFGELSRILGNMWKDAESDRVVYKDQFESSQKEYKVLLQEYNKRKRSLEELKTNLGAAVQEKKDAGEDKREEERGNMELIPSYSDSLPIVEKEAAADIQASSERKDEGNKCRVTINLPPKYNYYHPQDATNRNKKAKYVFNPTINHNKTHQLQDNDSLHLPVTRVSSDKDNNLFFKKDDNESYPPLSSFYPSHNIFSKSSFARKTEEVPEESRVWASASDSVEDEKDALLLFEDDRLLSEKTLLEDCKDEDKKSSQRGERKEEDIAPSTPTRNQHVDVMSNNYEHISASYTTDWTFCNNNAFVPVTPLKNYDAKKGREQNKGYDMKNEGKQKEEHGDVDVGHYDPIEYSTPPKLFHDDNKNSEGDDYECYSKMLHVLLPQM